MVFQQGFGQKKRSFQQGFGHFFGHVFGLLSPTPYKTTPINPISSSLGNSQGPHGMDVSRRWTPLKPLGKAREFPRSEWDHFLAKKGGVEKRLGWDFCMILAQPLADNLITVKSGFTLQCQLLHQSEGWPVGLMATSRRNSGLPNRNRWGFMYSLCSNRQKDRKVQSL